MFSVQLRFLNSFCVCLVSACVCLFESMHSNRIQGIISCSRAFTHASLLLQKHLLAITKWSKQNQSHRLKFSGLSVRVSRIWSTANKTLLLIIFQWDVRPAFFSHFVLFKNGFSTNQNDLIDIHLPTFRIWICNQRLALSLSNFIACVPSLFSPSSFHIKIWKLKIDPNLCNLLPYDSGKPLTKLCILQCNRQLDHFSLSLFLSLLMEANIYNLHIKLSYSSKRPSFRYHLKNRTVEVINDQFANSISNSIIL